MYIWHYEPIQKPLAKKLIGPNGEATDVLVSGYNMSIKLPSKYFACVWGEGTRYISLVPQH